LAALAKEGFQFDVTEINIETDDELHRDYLERLPVVEIDGREIGELEIPRAVLATELELAASMPPHDTNG
jgi:hypothetical protein